MAHGELELVNEAEDVDADTREDWTRPRYAALERDAWRLADALWAHHCPGHVSEINPWAATVRVGTLIVTITGDAVHFGRRGEDLGSVRRGRMTLGQLVERIAALAA